jgi:hypothetical protein
MIIFQGNNAFLFLSGLFYSPTDYFSLFVSECPDFSHLNTDLLAWYFAPLQEAEYHLANEDHYRYSLQLNCWGYTLDAIQGPVRDQVRETIYREAREFMHHDRELRIELARMRGMMQMVPVREEDSEIFHPIFDWYREQYETFIQERDQHYADVCEAGANAFSLRTPNNTVH